MSNPIAQEIMKYTSELSKRGEFEKALGYLHEQEKRYPQEPYILIYAGMICTSMGKTDEAIRYYTENINKFPGIHIHYNRIAELYEKRGMIDEAVQMWKKSLAIRDDHQVHSTMLQALLKSPTATSSALMREQKFWAKKYANQCFYNRNHTFQAWENDRIIRIGYACTFWHSTTIKYQLLPILQQHDRSKFKVFGYSASDAPKEYQSPVDVFRVVGNLDDDHFIQQVRSDHIDILVECTGFSPNHRFAAMAARCAPIQISYLNHTGTSGVAAIDYIIADDISLRRSEDKYFTEKIYRLPGSFFSFNYEDDPHPEPGQAPYLKNGFVTFGYFGSNGKLNDTLAGWWARILHEVPESKLYIRNNELNNPDERKHLENRFAKFGVDRSRLTIKPGSDRNGIINSYRDIDISLDSWPYCGGNTIAEALWQGVPVITLRGHRFSEAYGASLLAASGCPELVAETAETYIQKAVELGRNRNLISEYRFSLRGKVRSNGFNDSRAFALKLETAYLDMVRSLQAECSYDVPVELIKHAFSSGNPELKEDLIKRVWPGYFAKPEFAHFNRFLFNLSLSGLGINNSGQDDSSGEAWLIENLPQMLPADSELTVFDVGANDGSYSMKIAGAISDAQIHAFEPIPGPYSKLSESLQASRFYHHNIGLSDHKGSDQLYGHARNNGEFCTVHASLYPELFDNFYQTKRISHTIELDTIDDYCERNNIQKIDFLKIDTEGNEYKVLCGANNMLEKDAIRMIQFEFNYTHIYAKCFFNDFQSILKNFCFYRLLPKGLMRLNGNDVVENNIFQYQNILAVHDTQKHHLESFLESERTNAAGSEYLQFDSREFDLNTGQSIKTEDPGVGRSILNDMMLVLKSKKSAYTIFDVGGNEGQSALEFCKYFPQSRIFSFEPFPKTYQILIRNTKNYGNIKCHNIGLSVNTAKEQFYTSDHSCLNSLLPPGKQWAWKRQPLMKTSVLQLDSLDNFCRQHAIDGIDILKIDVQGGESLVLKGASRMLAAGKIRAIKLEVIFIELYERQAKFDEIYKALTDQDYKFLGFYDQFYDKFGRLYWGDALFIHRKEFDNLPVPDLP